VVRRFRPQLCVCDHPGHRRRRRRSAAFERTGGDRQLPRAVRRTVEGIYRSLPDGGFIDVNPALAQMFGFSSPAEMLTAPLKNPEEWYVDSERARELFEQLDREGRVVNAVSRVYRRDGSMIWISENMRAVPHADGHITFYKGTAVDVPDQRRGHDAIAAAEYKYRSLFQNAVTGMF